MSYIINVKQGNLLHEDNATFIVNASNTRLLLGSGVSMAFKHHCGYELQQEMTTLLEEMGSLKKGDVVATSSGKADNFKYTLHVAVMNYNQGARGNEKLPILDDIKNSLINIESYVQWYFNKNSNENVKLVLPLMGCGVGGLDKQEVIESYKLFFDRDVTFDCEVVIYGYDDTDYRLIKSIVKD